MSNPDGEFPTAIRGYDRGSVDDAIKDLRKEILSLSAQNSQLAAELRETTGKLVESLELVKEAGEPSYAGVGSKAALILATAEDISTRMLAESQNERERLLKDARSEVQELHGEAKGYYDALVAEAQRRADRLLNQAKKDADEMLSLIHI